MRPGSTFPASPGTVADGRAVKFLRAPARATYQRGCTEQNVITKQAPQTVR